MYASDYQDITKIDPPVNEGGQLSQLADCQLRPLQRKNWLLDTMLQKADPSQVAGLSRFFKTGKGQYGEGDKFLGIKVPVTREVVKECWKETSFEDLETCIRSEYHEMRLAALLSLVQIFKHAKKDTALQQQCIDFYLSHTQCINNWDLVDLRTLLYDLSRDGKTIWEQRIGMVSTMQFVRHGELDDTYAIADIFLEKPKPLHDLLQKAVGWLLREAGKRDEQRLKDWLSTRYTTMPRTMLRYAIEKFSDEERACFMNVEHGLPNDTDTLCVIARSEATKQSRKTKSENPHD